MMNSVFKMMNFVYEGAPESGTGRGHGDGGDS